MTVTRNALRLLVLTFLLHGLCAPPAEARRVALVIGNAAYRIGPLANPLNDAAAVAEAFEKQLRFDKVMLRTNLGFIEFRAALAELAREASGADLGVVYFAGHGTEVGGRNFLIPVDATLSRVAALDLEAIALDTVLAQLDGVRKLKLVILDACRNNPFALPGAKRSVTRGLARIEPEDNTLVVYAAKDGTAADDGVGRRHSPFTEAFLKHIPTPGVEVRFVLGRLRDEVVAMTKAGQTPHIYGTLGGREHYLLPAGATTVMPPPSGVPPGEAEQAWQEVKGSTSIAALEAFRARFGGSFYAELARIRIEELRKAQEAKTAAPELHLRPEKAMETAFGTHDAVFAVGVWNVVRTKKYDHHDELYFWTDRGEKVVQVTIGSNGWWRLRRRSGENVVWGDGKTNPQALLGRPWEGAAASFSIGAGQYTGRGKLGTTRVVVGGGEIRLILTNNGEIRLDARSSRITFRTHTGRTVEF